MDIRRLLGRNIRRRRLELGLTQEQFAEKSGFDQRYVSQLENGRRSPSIVSLHELAVALDTTPVVLITPDGGDS